MSRRDSATRLLLLASLSKQVTQATTAAKAAAGGDFDRVGVRDVGIVGDEQIGHVRVDRGKKNAGVTDPAKFLTWAKANHPEAVETVERVRPDVQARWLAEVKNNGGVLNEKTGEIAEPDGVSVWKGDPTIVVSPAADAARVIRDAVAAGTLDLGSALAIEAGESR